MKNLFYLLLALALPSLLPAEGKKVFIIREPAPAKVFKKCSAESDDDADDEIEIVFDDKDAEYDDDEDDDEE